MTPFEVIQRAALETDSVLVSFSAGRDSIITLDLCKKYIKRVECVYFYWAQGLRLYHDLFDNLRNRYGGQLIIHEYPYPDIVIYEAGLLGKKIKYKFIDGINDCRAKTNIAYCAYGYRVSESLQRRARISPCGGIDRRNKFIYPVAYWSKSHIERYVKHEKLPLLETYRNGFRDISILNRNTLEFLRNNFYSDYEILLNKIPLLESRLYVK